MQRGVRETAATATVITPPPTFSLHLCCCCGSNCPKTKKRVFFASLWLNEKMSGKCGVFHICAICAKVLNFLSQYDVFQPKVLRKKMMTTMTRKMSDAEEVIGTAPVQPATPTMRASKKIIWPKIWPRNRRLRKPTKQPRRR